MLGPHLSKHVQQPDGASHLPTKDGGDHGVDATAAYPAMLRDANARQHRDEGHQDDEGYQEQAQEHTCVSLQQSGGRVSDLGETSHWSCSQQQHCTPPPTGLSTGAGGPQRSQEKRSARYLLVLLLS